MKFEIRKLKQEGSLFNKHFPKCMVCGREIPNGEGVEFKTGAIGVGCGCMSLVSFALAKKDAKTFADIEFSEEQYERMNYKISARCKELAEEALNNCLVVDTMHSGHIVMNSIVLDDKFSDAYDLAKGLREADLEKEYAIYYQTALDKDIPMAIVTTIHIILTAAAASECSFDTSSEKYAIEKFVTCTLGWRIYPSEPSGYASSYNDDFLYYDGFRKGIDYSKIPEVPKDVETVQIYDYECSVNVKLSEIEYAVLWNAFNEIFVIVDAKGRQRKALIVKELYNEKHINPRLLDTLACVVAGLMKAEGDNITGITVQNMLIGLFGWKFD